MIKTTENDLEPGAYTYKLGGIEITCLDCGLKASEHLRGDGGHELRFRPSDYQTETLRDRFAMQCLSAIVEHDLAPENDHRTVGFAGYAVAAYEIADAMLEARDK